MLTQPSPHPHLILSQALATFIDSNLVRQFFSANRKELLSIFMMFAKADGSDIKVSHPPLTLS